MNQIYITKLQGSFYVHNREYVLWYKLSFNVK